MAHTPKNQSEKAILTARRAWCYLVLVLISFLCLFFFYVLIINSTRTHFEIQKGFSLIPGKSIITNFRNVLTDANIPVISGIRNSLLVSACSAALSVYFSALTAYGIYAYNFKFKKAAFALILLIMTMPTQVSALGFLQLISKMGLKNSFIPLIVPSIAAPTVFFFMKQYLDASLPMEIVEAARIDGAGEFYTFNKIVLPIMKPALAVQAIFSFVASWNNYFIPALVLDSADKKTLPILIAQLRSADFLKFDMGKVYMMAEQNLFPDSMKVKAAISVTADFIPGFDAELALELGKKFGLPLNKKVKALSTGYASILRIVLALSAGTPYVIFDEPVLGLDAQHRDMFYRLLMEHCGGGEQTVIISTHLIQEAAPLIEHAVIIKDGEIIRNAPAEELKGAAHTVTGPAGLVDGYTAGRRVLSATSIGGLKTACVEGEPEGRIPAGLEVSPMGLQDYFISLMNEEGAK